MNHLSQLILQGGEEHKPAIIPGVVYRQFLPHGREVSVHLRPLRKPLKNTSGIQIQIRLFSKSKNISVNCDEK